MDRRRLSNLFDEGGTVDFGDQTDLSAYATDRSRPAQSRCDALARPTTTNEVLQLVRFAAQSGTALVPSGGRTGLAGGAVASAGEVVVSLERMDTLLAVDEYLPAAHVQSGMVTARLQKEAADRGYHFPIDFAAAGSATIGGIVGTNAGGVHVIRYGMLRDWVLGLTVVTGAGEILRTGGPLLKDNTGYDLRNIFIGAEGTLGIVTEVWLRLTSPPASQRVFLAALPDFGAGLRALRAIRASADQIHLFEIFDRTCLEVVMRHLELPDPFREPAPFYLLLEVETGQGDAVETIASSGLFLDALEAESSQGRSRFRAYREQISESLALSHEVHKNDISLPLPELEGFLQWLAEVRRADGPRAAVFGHLGDGNLHLNWIKPTAMTESDFRARMQRLDQETYTELSRRGGSISAEHGIGRLKREHLHLNRSPEELALMRSLKATLDPQGILNPGKLLPDPS